MTIVESSAGIDPGLDLARPNDCGRSNHRYSAANQIFHWLTAVMMIAILVLGWIMEPGVDGPEKLGLWEWHKTLGIVVLFTTAVRLVWRFFDPPPPAPAYQPNWDHRLATATYAMFFAAMLWFPITGYIYSTAGGHAPVLFNLIQTPALIGPNEDYKELAKSLHRGSQWFLYGLILLHIAGVVYHAAIRRDVTLERMLPEPRLYDE